MPGADSRAQRRRDENGSLRFLFPHDLNQENPAVVHRACDGDTCTAGQPELAAVAASDQAYASDHDRKGDALRESGPGEESPPRVIRTDSTASAVW